MKKGKKKFCRKRSHTKPKPAPTSEELYQRMIEALQAYEKAREEYAYSKGIDLNVWP